MSDFDYSLDFPCGPGMGCPCREAERAAIVAWLREGGQGMKLVAAAIERGEHLGGDECQVSGSWTQ